MIIAAVLNALLLALLGISAYALLSRIPAEALQLNTEQAREAAGRFLLLTAQGLASLMALFVAIFASVGAIGNEIERGTILAVAARPVDRWEILIGKFLGNALLAVAYLVGQTLIISALIAVVMGIWTPDLLVSLALLSLNVFVVVAIAVAGSTRLSAMPNAIAVTALYFAVSGPATGILYTLGQLFGSDLVQQIADWGRYALPVTPVSDLAAQILGGPLVGSLRSAAGSEVTLPVRDWVWIYALVYLVGALVLGVWSLNRRDLR